MRGSGYNAGMSLKNVDMDSALRRLADRRIEEAMAEGKFDNNPLAGKDIDFEPMPAEENARLMWWALRIMKQNDVTPDEERWRKAVDQLAERLAAAVDESKVIAIVRQINELVHKVNTMGTNAIAIPLVPVSVEGELERFRDRQQQRQGG